MCPCPVGYIRHLGFSLAPTSLLRLFGAFMLACTLSMDVVQDTSVLAALLSFWSGAVTSYLLAVTWPAAGKLAEQVNPPPTQHTDMGLVLVSAIYLNATLSGVAAEPLAQDCRADAASSPLGISMRMPPTGLHEVREVNSSVLTLPEHAAELEQYGNVPAVPSTFCVLVHDLVVHLHTPLSLIWSGPRQC